MTYRVQIVRMPEAEANQFRGKAGEFVFDITNAELIIHDGVTVGGHRIARKTLANIVLASINQDGIMTKEQVQQLQTLEQTIDTLQTSQGTNAAAITALQTALNALTTRVSTAEGLITTHQFIGANAVITPSVAVQSVVENGRIVWGSAAHKTNVNWIDYNANPSGMQIKGPLVGREVRAMASIAHGAISQIDQYAHWQFIFSDGTLLPVDARGYMQPGTFLGIRVELISAPFIVNSTMTEKVLQIRLQTLQNKPNLDVYESTWFSLEVLR